ncbi:PREDICTED: protein BOLA4, chloroplastic/mitochondrial-like [Camelina sativa]|uniref:Protein BOLA4, chloroplastic/mitochondrial-like n=1 Tax=Camelina sativa TaxID=90675 RepID=A0ABM0XY78_CAMSA|nr:PREDICTED: protein BOLA4, chloroplastic/mitochondrial-like [Camelina sativa]
MANTLMATARPHVLLSSTRASLRLLFRSPKRPFASFSSPLVVRSFNSRCLTAVLSRGEKTAPPPPSSSIYINGVSRVSSGFGIVDIRSRDFSTRSSQINDAGSIDLTLMQSMELKIKEQLNAESVTVTDMSGDGRHVCINVVSSAFEGQSAVNRQRMVYKAIWEELQNVVHAVDQMTTKTPSEV